MINYAAIKLLVYRGICLNGSVVPAGAGRSGRAGAVSSTDGSASLLQTSQDIKQRWAFGISFVWNFGGRGIQPRKILPGKFHLWIIPPTKMAVFLPANQPGHQAAVGLLHFFCFKFSSIRPFDLLKLYSSKVEICTLQACYWLYRAYLLSANQL